MVGAGLVALDDLEGCEGVRKEGNRARGGDLGYDFETLFDGK